MTALAIGQALLTYGPTIMAYVLKVQELIAKRGEGHVTAEDIAEIIDYGQQKADDYLKAIGYVAPTDATKI